MDEVHMPIATRSRRNLFKREHHRNAADYSIVIDRVGASFVEVECRAWPGKVFERIYALNRIVVGSNSIVESPLQANVRNPT